MDRQRRPTEPRPSTGQLDPETDWHQLYKRTMLWRRRPREARLGFQLAFYRAFAVPKMARVLAETGHFKRDTMRRAYDTGIVIHEIIYGGLDSERGRKMIRLMNALHDRPDIQQPELSYLLNAIIVVPTRHIARAGRRPLNAAERTASWRFCRELGMRMGIQNLPNSYAEAEAQDADQQRQVMRLLIAGQDGFLTEARDVLRAGLETAAWVSVDDTGARHAGKNGFCTQIGNDDFTWFGTRTSKSRLNFLDLLRAGHTDYVINQAALDYMRVRALAGPVINQLAAHRQTQFADQAAWQMHLDRLGISALQVTPDPVCIATEGALWGSIQAHGLLRDMVIVSDDAGQFTVGQHALCWVHAERLVHKLDAFTDLHRAAQERMRALIWWFYDDLKAYRAEPTARRRGELRARFDRIFRRRTGFVTLDRLLQRLHANKPELLMVLDRPEIPLHTAGHSVSARTHSLSWPACLTRAATGSAPVSSRGNGRYHREETSIEEEGLDLIGAERAPYAASVQ